MTEQKTDNSQTFFYLGIAAVIAVVLVALWLLLAKEDSTEPKVDLLPPPVTVPVTLPEPAPLPEPEPEPERVSEPAPVAVAEPEPEPEPALPALDNADPEVKQRLLALNWRPGLASLFVTEDMLRNFVVQTDNIAQGQLATGHPLLQPLAQKFTLAPSQPLQLDGDSFKRYEPYMQLLQSVPPQHMVALFNRYEPLLQQAFAELGYPDELFKSRLLQAIDVLLATPEQTYPLQLEQPSVMYVFADAQIEQLPAAQKQMLRLGPDNLRKLKALLSQYRAVLSTT